MDDEPFLTFDITNMNDIAIENVSKFKKESFNTDYLVKYAEELVYTSALNDTLKDLFKNPSDEFIRFLIKDFSNIRVTNNVLERFRPIVKKAISNAVLDIVSKGLYQQEAAALEDENKVDKPEDLKFQNNDESSSGLVLHEHKKKEVVTTKEELDSFEMIKSILKSADKNLDYINYKDTTNYFSIFNKNTTRWFIRLQLDMSNKNIMTKLPIDEAQKLSNGFKVEEAPKGIGESRIYINSYSDIKSLDKLIIACFEYAELN